MRIPSSKSTLGLWSVRSVITRLSDFNNWLMMVDWMTSLPSCSAVSS